MTQAATNGEPITNAITTTAHSTLSHTGIPGVGDLSTAAHAALDHTGFPGVGNLATGPGVGLVDHTVLDHTGIPGVGGPVNDNITVLEAGSTATQINTALTTYSIVYLKPGNYGTLSTKIIIPDDKSLIGISSGPQDGIAYGALLNWNSTTTMIDIGRGSRMEGIAMNASAAGSVDLVNILGGPGWTTMRNCFVSAASWTGTIISAQNSMPHLENIGIYGIPKTGSAPAIDYDPTAGSNTARCAPVFRNIRIEFNTGGGGARPGIVSQDGGIFETCWVSHAGGHGFDFSESVRITSVFGCRATNCGGDGFHHTAPGPWIAVFGNQATSNTGWGFFFNFGISGSTLRGSVVGNAANSNTAGNFTINTGYINSGNA